MVEFWFKNGQIWKWSYSKHVYQIPYAVFESAWEPSESPSGPELDRVKNGPRNNNGEVKQLILTKKFLTKNLRWIFMVPVTFENETVLKRYFRLYDLDVSNFMATFQIFQKIVKFESWILKIHDLSCILEILPVQKSENH